MAFQKQIKDEIYGTVIFQSDILKTCKDQRYIVVINQVVWYAVHVFIETDTRFEDQTKFQPNNSLCHILHFKVSDHWSLEGAKEKFSEIKKKLWFTGNKKSDLPAWLQLNNPITTLKIKNGKEAIDNPDKYILPGDHIQVYRVAVYIGAVVYQHSAIYIGNKKVIQVSDPEHESSKQRACVNEADWSSFHCGDSNFRVCIPKIKNRTPQEIVEAAKSKIGFYKNEYNALSKNCQHFATNCQFGDGFGCLVSNGHNS